MWLLSEHEQTELVEAVPIRQWVLSFPIEIRYRLAYDSPLLGAVLRSFLQQLEAY